MVVPQHILDFVDPDRMVFVVVLPAVTTQDLHLESAWYYLALTAIFEAVVLRPLRRSMRELPPLRLSSIAADLDRWTASACCSAGQHKRDITQRI
jgi:hypothetical protein